MRLLAVFPTKILRTTARPHEHSGKMSIIIRRPYAYLEAKLAKAFQGQSEVEVIVERRSGERRTRVQPVGIERRIADRRRPKEEIAEVVITG